MFMFVYSVLIITVVGLFFQIISALGMYFSMQQTGLGMQMSRWHAMVYEFACDDDLLAGVGLTKSSGFSTAAPESPSGVGAAVANVSSNIDGSGNKVYKGVSWDSVAFTGSYGGTSQRLVITYVSPTGTYAGVPGKEVGRQLRRIGTGVVRTSAVYSLSGLGAVDLTSRLSLPTGASTETMTVSGIPASVPLGSNVIITVANCGS